MSEDPFCGHRNRPCLSPAECKRATACLHPLNLPALTKDEFRERLLYLGRVQSNVTEMARLALDDTGDVRRMRATLDDARMYLDRVEKLLR